MTKTKEKMVNVLIDTLSYCYCDNCKYGDYEKYGDRHCDECHRKYVSWALSPEVAEEIVNKIIDIYKEEDLINRLSQLGDIGPTSYDEYKKGIEKIYEELKNGK